MADTPVGVRCDEAGLQDYIRLQKHHQVRYIIYDINKEEVIYVRHILEKTDEDKALSPQEQFEKFTKVLMQYDAAYATYDAEYLTPDGVKREKVLFLFWCNDNSHVNTRMYYTCSKGILRGQFKGVHTNIEAHDADDLEWETVQDKIERFKR